MKIYYFLGKFFILLILLIYNTKNINFQNFICKTYNHNFSIYFFNHNVKNFQLKVIILWKKHENKNKNKMIK